MNWTEGNLARHSRGRQNKAALRQKEHFAKARLGLLSGSKKSPPDISFLNQASSHPLATHHEIQDKLSSAAHVRHSCRPGSSSLTGKKRPRAPSTSSQPAGPRHSAAVKTRDVPAISPFFNLSFGGRDGPDGSKRIRPGHDDGSPEDLALRKERLLLKADWAGVSVQKPIKVQFSRVTSGPEVWSKARASSSKRVRRLIGDRYDEASRDRHRENRHEKHGDILPGARRHGVRVRVGSMERRLGESSSLVDWARTEQASLSSCFMSGALPSQRARHLSSQPSTSGSRVEKEKPTHRARHILGSSPLIYQPVPRRPPPTWLPPPESLPSDATDSLVVQVGNHKSPVPASLKEDNEIWKKWVDLSTSSNVGTDSNMGMDGSQCAPRRPRISPGISEWQPHATSNAAETVRMSGFPPSGPLSCPANGEIAGAEKCLPVRENSKLPAIVEYTAKGLVPATAQSQDTDQFEKLHAFIPESETRSVLPQARDPKSHSDSERLPTFPSITTQRFHVSASPSFQDSPVHPGTQNETRHSSHPVSHTWVFPSSVPMDEQALGLPDIEHLAMDHSSPIPHEPAAMQVSSKKYSMADRSWEFNGGAPGQDRGTRGTMTHAAMSAEEIFEQEWRRLLFGNDGSDDGDGIKKIAFADSVAHVAKELRPSSSARDRDEGLATDSIYSDELPERGAVSVSDPEATPESHLATAASSSEARIRSSLVVVPASVTAYGPSLPSSPPLVPSPESADLANDTSTQTGGRRVSTTPEDRASAAEGSQDVSRGVFAAGAVAPRTAAGNSSKLASRSSDELIVPPVDLTRLVSASRQAGDGERVAARSPAGQAPQPRFVPPKSFVGKLSMNKAPSGPPGGGAFAPLSLHEKVKTRGRGRPKKRARDGRADIRALPNYSGDPIEEIEEDDGGPSSLFGALDME